MVLIIPPRHKGKIGKKIKGRARKELILEKELESRKGQRAALNYKYNKVETTTYYPDRKKQNEQKDETILQED